VALAGDFGYRWIRVPGLIYGYVVEDLQSSVSLLTMGAIRSKPQVAVMVRDGDVVDVLLMMLCRIVLQLCSRLLDVGDMLIWQRSTLHCLRWPTVAVVCFIGGSGACPAV
jgi:hypothetical protein